MDRCQVKDLIRHEVNSKSTGIIVLGATYTKCYPRQFALDSTHLFAIFCQMNVLCHKSQGWHTLYHKHECRMFAPYAFSRRGYL